MSLAFTFIFVIRSSEISLEKQQLSDQNKTSFIVEAFDGTDTELLSETVNNFINSNADYSWTYTIYGNMHTISSFDTVEPLYASFKTALYQYSDTVKVSYYNSLDMLKSMGTGIEYITAILSVIVIVISAVVIVGFVGFVMLMLLQREHDMLVAYLCGVSLRKLLLMSMAEISIVGVLSSLIGCVIGYVITPSMGSMGAAGIYHIAPQVSALSSIMVLLLIIYIGPLLVFSLRMKAYNPLVQIRREEN